MQTLSRRGRRPSPDVNVTPLVDVLLVLVAVLILAMPLYVKRLPVDLPQTDLAGAPLPVKAVSVALTADGGMLLDGVAATEATVAAALSPSITVELSVAKDVKYETIAKALATLQSKRPKEIVLLTR